MRTRLLALDADGTLVDPDGELQPAVCNAVRAARDRGLAIVICTGRRYRTSLSLTLFEIDQLKSINDRYGNKLGDTAVRKVARLLATHVRKRICSAAGTAPRSSRFSPERRTVVPRSSPTRSAATRRGFASRSPAAKSR